MDFFIAYLRNLRGIYVLQTLAAGTVALAQNVPSTYDPRLTFAPLTLPDPVNAYRSSNGSPGPGYWQNEADYELHATLDSANKQLRATEIITYTNNSPDALPSLWIQLEQNLYRKDSRGQAIFGSFMRRRRNAAPAPISETTTEGFVFDSV